MSEEESSSTTPLNAIQQAAGVEIRAGTWFVRRTFSYREPEIEEGTIAVRPFVSAPAYVRWQYGLTANMGNFESARVDVSLSMPCYPAEVDPTADAVIRWVNDRMEKEQGELQTEATRRRNAD